MPKKPFEHGNFKVPNTELREDFSRTHKRMGNEFSNLSYEEQYALMRLCIVAEDDTQTEQNYLELIHYLVVQNEVKMSAVHAKIRMFSEHTTRFAMRLCVEQLSNRQDSSAPAAQSTLVGAAVA